MRNLLLLAALTLSITLSSAQNNGGFFSGLTNAFNNIFGGSDNRPQQQPQRRPPQQFQQQQQQFQPQQQQQQFFQPQQQQFQPQQQQFQPQQQQQQFQPRPSQGNFQQQQAPVFRPQAQQPPRVVQSSQSSQPSFSSSSNSISGGTAKCAAQAPNHFWRGKGYVATWKFGCSNFEQHEAKEYCQSMGMEPVSLDTPDKQNEFNRLIAQDAQRFFWTGGIVDHANQLVGWSNPSASTIRFSDSAHWSHTGGAGLPQPDNRAAGEQPPSPEVCLAILNNFYADGIKWHDVACHHKKPTVCEPRN